MVWAESKEGGETCQAHRAQSSGSPVEASKTQRREIAWVRTDLADTGTSPTHTPGEEKVPKFNWPPDPQQLTSSLQFEGLQTEAAPSLHLRPTPGPLCPPLWFLFHLLLKIITLRVAFLFLIIFLKFYVFFYSPSHIHRILFHSISMAGQYFKIQFSIFIAPILSLFSL